MSYSAGMMNKRVAVMNPATETQGDFGRQSAGRQFVFAGTFWMAEDFNRGTKSMREGALDAYDTVMFRCRAYVPVKRTSMLVYQGKTWQITSFNEDYQANTIQITATEAPGKDLSYLLNVALRADGRELHDSEGALIMVQRENQ